MDHLSKVMATREGRKFINDLLAFCGVYQSTTGDVNDILRQEGKRQVGLYILSNIQEQNRHLLYKMMDEAYTESKEKQHDYTSELNKRRADHYSGLDPDPREYFGYDDYSSGGHASDDLNLNL